MFSEAILKIVQMWPYIGFGTFMIFISLLAVRYKGAFQLNQKLTVLLLSFMILGPISIPVACHTYKELP